MILIFFYIIGKILSAALGTKLLSDGEAEGVPEALVPGGPGGDRGSQPAVPASPILPAASATTVPLSSCSGIALPIAALIAK